MGLWGCEQMLGSAEKEELQMCVSQIFPCSPCWLCCAGSATGRGLGRREMLTAACASTGPAGTGIQSDGSYPERRKKALAVPWGEGFFCPLVLFLPPSHPRCETLSPLKDIHLNRAVFPLLKR